MSRLFLLFAMLILASEAFGEQPRVGLLTFADDTVTSRTIDHHIRVAGGRHDIDLLAVSHADAPRHPRFAETRKQCSYGLVILELTDVEEACDAKSFVEIPVTTPPPMHLTELRVVSTNAGNNRRRGRVIAIVRDEDGKPIEGAVVSGYFSEPFEEEITAVTGENGRATLIAGLAVKLSFKYQFCIREIVHNAYIHEPKETDVLCGTFTYEMPR